MGNLLKEALKFLCGVNQWSYAVFWKIGCQNPKLLIWEECHYEPVPCSAIPHSSGSESSKMPFEDWVECWLSPETCISQLSGQVENRVHSLINRMMMSNQVNVVGEGIVGRAAFTGNHQWILSENYVSGAHPPEVLNEVRHQYSAGMQTVAVIPVLPHGVVQLGSSLLIQENMRFVKDVKSLIFQLGRVPDALLSDNYTTNESARKIGIPISLGTSVSVDPSELFKVTNSTSFISDSCNLQSNSSQASRLVGEPSDSQKKIQENPQTAAVTFQTPNLTQTSVKPHDDHCQPEVVQAIKTNTFRIQRENAVTGAIVIPPNIDAWLKHEASPYGPGLVFNHQPSVGQSGASCSNLRLIEQQVFSNADLRDQVKENQSASNSFITSQLRTNGGLIRKIDRGSVTAPLLEESGLDNGMTCHLRPSSVLCSLSNPHRSTDYSLSSINLHGAGLQKANSSKTAVVPLSTLAGHLATSRMISGCSDPRHDSTDKNHPQIELVPRKQRSEGDFFQALNIPLTHSDEHMPLSEHIPGSLHDSRKHNCGSQSPMLRDATFEDAYVQPSSGDDLFDVLGADFKNKLLNGNWNGYLINGLHANKNNTDKDTPTSMNLLEAGPDFYSVSEGISENSIFSGAGTDHLLDAVVSKVHSAAKQNSDDNVSCRTTLTKISSSSVPSTSPTFGQVSMSSQMKREAFSLSKPLGKAETVGSSSFRSGCSKDDAGNCSQTNSIYGSKINSWVEQAHNVKRDSSVSTAYSKRPDEISKSNRKRLKPGENPRPRPKDRQMIQDRVKELREIVPNGGKCSIDALLERTIKHMLFLQSVTKHADKLKQTGESKIISKEGGLLLKDNFEGGATWAFEVGSQSMVCPIIVEDLNPPRQMLVEMLCEERGFFLEIADIIRGLGLTILKGVMEARNDKIWARFAVEANRDVTRMEIFISLVRLLEQTVKAPASSNDIHTDNMMVHQSFHQATCIPATDRPSSFQ